MRRWRRAGRASDTVEETRSHPERVARKGIDDVADYYAQVIRGLDAAPIVIGHSFGGLIAQRLLGQDVAAETGSGADAPIGKEVHAPPQAHGLPDGAGQHDNPADGTRQRTKLGRRGFSLNRRAARHQSAPRRPPPQDANKCAQLDMQPALTVASSASKAARRFGTLRTRPARRAHASSVSGVCTRSTPRNGWRR